MTQILELTDREFEINTINMFSNLMAKTDSIECKQRDRSSNKDLKGNVKN